MMFYKIPVGEVSTIVARVSVIFLIFIAFGCARIKVESTEPIKVDINMRVDVYQHVVEDIGSINDQIYGSGEKDFNALFVFQEAYAADLPQEASAAISRRKARVNKIEEYFIKGYVGENRDAFLQIIAGVPVEAKGEVENLIGEENKDRKIIYEAIADKNKIDILTVRKAAFADDYERALSGYWFEVCEGDGYVWVKK